MPYRVGDKTFMSSVLAESYARQLAGGGSGGQSDLAGLVEGYTQMASNTRAAQEQRQAQIEAIADEIIARYRPGGAFGQGYEAELAKTKIRDVGATAQRDISRGLYGIRPYEAEWESTVGAPARLKLEDIRMERLGQAQWGKASFLERIEEPYPDYGPLMQAAMSAQQGGGSVPIEGISMSEAWGDPFEGLTKLSPSTSGPQTATSYGPSKSEVEKWWSGRKAELESRIASRQPTTVEGYGPMFGNVQDVPQAAEEGQAQVEERQKPETTAQPAISYTASLLSRYNRWKKSFKRQNPRIPESNIASYENWYTANILRK